MLTTCRALEEQNDNELSFQCLVAPITVFLLFILIRLFILFVKLFALPALKLIVEKMEEGSYDIKFQNKIED